MVPSTSEAATTWRARAMGSIRAARRHPGGSAALAGLWAWWATQLWGLPDIGEPFGVAAYDAVRVPDVRNAPPSPGALVGPDLEALPEGFDAPVEP